MLVVQPAQLPAAGEVDKKLPPAAQSAPKQQYTCDALAVLIINQEKESARRLRSLKRDMAALQQKIDQPGINDIIAGLGYILGLFGTAAFVASRRNHKTQNR